MIAVTGVVLSSGLTSYLALNKFETVFAPEMENKAQTVGESVKSLMTKLMNYGVPFDRLRGLDEEFAKILEDNLEISFLNGPRSEWRSSLQSGIKIEQILANSRG